MLAYGANVYSTAATHCPSTMSSYATALSALSTSCMGHGHSERLCSEEARAQAAARAFIMSIA